MRADLIDRQAAIDAMCELMHHWFGGDPKDEIREIKRELEGLPPAQPCEKEAVWALHTYMPHSYYCTNCKQDSPYNKRWDYCPHCGFKMGDYV